jgi:hypothetical protein
MTWSGRIGQADLFQCYCWYADGQDSMLSLIWVGAGSEAGWIIWM